MTTQNLKWTNAAHTDMYLETDEVVLGEMIPMILHAGYDTAAGADLFAAALAGDFGNIAPYVVPPFIRTVPQVVSRFQGMAALYQAGMLEGIETYMGSPTTDGFTKLAWKEVQEFRRQSPMVASIGTMFGMTDSQLDDLFIFANTISA